MERLIKKNNNKAIKLRLGRDLVRAIKRGHPWIFADALRELPPARPGSPAILLDNKKGREVARGFYDPTSPLAFRACTVETGQQPNQAWAKAQMQRAVDLRRVLFGPETNAYRLFNGEGDNLPGLTVDIYNDTAVIKLDGDGPSSFWNASGIAGWLAEELQLASVYLRQDRRKGKNASESGTTLWGKAPAGPISFLEHGVAFTADVVQGQKTGFFLDQRENRNYIRGIAQDRRVLNVFGYTGGFSVYAGLGGAEHVTTVDLAQPAIEAAEHHWALNHLPPQKHLGVTVDAFQFLENAAKKGDLWDIVIVDPPSFVPAKSALPQGSKAYQKLIAAGAGVTADGGILAAASCSSHVGMEAFLHICEEGISQARRRATVLGVFGQPADHPAPLVLPEFRYLKFVLLQV